MSNRPLERSEIQALERRGVTALSGWAAIQVGRHFHPDSLRNCWIEGPAFLNTQEPDSVRDSRLAAVSLDRCRVYRCDLESVTAAEGVSLVRVNARPLEGAHFGWDADLRPGNEALSRAQPRRDLSWEEVAGWSPSEPSEAIQTVPISSTFTNVFEPEASAQDCPFLAGVYCDQHTMLLNVSRVENSSLLSRERPCRLAHGPQVVRSVLDGVTVEGSVLIRDSWIFPQSVLTDGLCIRHSILGPYFEASSAEIVACLLGPGIGLHHRSLLIAARWPSGLGNVASGAQVGSNHTGRAPDSSAWISEGWFFGLNCTVQYPLDLSQAPFGLVGAGQRLPSGHYPFPFSLYGSRDNRPRVRPGWLLDRGLLVLFRNEMKWRSRLPDLKGYRILRPPILRLVANAASLLESLSFPHGDDPVLFPQAGPCPLTAADRDRGLKVYRELLQGMTEGGPRPAFARQLYERLLSEVQREDHPESFRPVLDYFRREYGV